MRVLHVISSISRQGGGPSRSSQGLVAGLHFAGIDVWLMTLSNGEEPWIEGCEQFVNGGAFEDALLKVKPDLVHLHGIWDRRLHRCAVVCRRRHIPYVIAPRGMLEPWSLKQKWLKKRVARFLYQDNDLHKAAALHATAESEAEQFRKLGFKNPIIVSPNGVNLPDEKKVGGESRSTKDNSSSSVDLDLFSRPKRVLFVSRMHPKKGVLELVESWARVFNCGERVEHGDWVCELVYTLNGDTERTYEQQVKDRILDLCMSYQDKDGTIHSTTTTNNYNFIFTGPLNDDAKWQAYARADLFILPTYSENFGIVVAEALYAGIPVITTKGTPWHELETHHCGWWIDLPEKKVGGESRSTVDWPSLDAALKEATTIHYSPSSLTFTSLHAMGENGHKLIQEKYTWPAIAKTMIAGYKKILENRSRK